MPREKKATAVRIAHKRSSREEAPDEATQLYLDGQIALRASLRSNSLKDAMSRSLTQIMGENTMRSEASERVSSLQVSPLSMSTSSQPLGTPFTFPLSTRSDERTTILDLTNRFVDAVQKKRASRVECVLQLNQQRSLASPMSSGSTLAGQRPLFPATEVELEIEGPSPLTAGEVEATAVNEPTAASQDGSSADFEVVPVPAAVTAAILETSASLALAMRPNSASRASADSEYASSDEGFEGENFDDESTSDASVRYERKARRKQAARRAARKERERAEEEPDSDQDEDRARDDLVTERIKRRHEMERLKRAMKNGALPLATEVNPRMGGPAPAIPNVPPTAPAAVLSFHDAAAKRREALTRQASTGLFASASAETVQMLHRSNSYDNSVGAPVVFDRKPSRVAQPEAESANPAISGARKTKKKLSLVSKVG